MKKIVSIVLLSFLVLFLQGCITVESNLTFNKDKSCDEKCRVYLPALLADSMPSEYMNQLDQWKDNGYTISHESVNGKNAITMSKHYPTVEEYIKGSRVDPATGKSVNLSDTVSYKVTDYIVYRSYKYTEKICKSADDTNALKKVSSAITLKRNVTLPAHIVSTNADSYDGCTASWDFSKDENIDKLNEITAVAGEWNYLMAGVAGVILFGIICVGLFIAIGIFRSKG